MERNNRKNIFIMLIVFVLALAGTNLATYYLTSGGDLSNTGEGQTKVIRYEPSNSNIDPDAGIIFEAIEIVFEFYCAGIASKKNILV